MGWFSWFVGYRRVGYTVAFILASIELRKSTENMDREPFSLIMDIRTNCKMCDNLLSEMWLTSERIVIGLWNYYLF